MSIKVKLEEVEALDVCPSGLSNALNLLGGEWPEEGLSVEDALEAGIPLQHIIYVASILMPRNMCFFAVEVAEMLVKRLDLPRPNEQIDEGLRVAREALKQKNELNKTTRDAALRGLQNTWIQAEEDGKVLLMGVVSIVESALQMCLVHRQYGNFISLRTSVEAWADAFGRTVESLIKRELISKRDRRIIFRKLIKWSNRRM